LSSQLIPRNTHYPYTIPFPQPEPEPLARRLFRRLVRNQSQDQNLDPAKSTKYPVTTTLGTPTVKATIRTSLPERTNISKIQEETLSSSEKVDNSIFYTSSESNPWLINTAQFDIVPAVPSKHTANNIEKVPKDMSEDSRDEKDLVKQNYDHKQFIPVAAVPDATTASVNKISREPQNALKIIEEDTGENKKVPGDDTSCLEKCSEQFCVAESFTISNCVDMCKTLCS
jgi:hypothetical protein